MTILVVGCGKVGSRLASVLDKMGHDISVVDQDERNFHMLDADFNGFTTIGVPIDQDVLRRAGIENCDALAAVTHDDNVNIMVAQLAREFFKIERVIVRIYDPSREDVFSHFGLSTICPTNLTVASVCSALTDEEETRNMTFGTQTVSFSSIKVPSDLVGKRSLSVTTADNEQLFGVSHIDGTFTMTALHPVILKRTDRLVFAIIID